MDRIRVIRQEEKAYHDSCYENYRLFEAGSWLHKPVQTVMELLPFFKDHQTLDVLDLGSGVGRNSIPIAEWIRDYGKNGRVVCVDLLDSAIGKLNTYSDEFQVTDYIQPMVSSIENYSIEEQAFDFIVAVSSLEHVESMEMLKKVLKQIAKGIKPGGIICIIINSELEEIDENTGQVLDVKVEVNISTEKMKQLLQTTFHDLTMINYLVKPLAYKINRNNREILLKTNAITYVAKSEVI